MTLTLMFLALPLSPPSPTVGTQGAITSQAWKLRLGCCVCCDLGERSHRVLSRGWPWWAAPDMKLRRTCWT